MKEFKKIKKFFSPLAKSRINGTSLDNDAALLELSSLKNLVVTTDTLVEKIHFGLTDNPCLIAKKLMRINLSDLAAMGSSPLAYLLNLALPKKVTDQWLGRFTLGLKEDQKKYNIFLAGGDTVATTGPIVLSLTAFGFNQKGLYHKRSGAKEGDFIFVSGTVGDSALGLISIKKELKIPKKDREFLIQKYFLPEPRISLGEKLLTIASSAIDVSDGLAQDINHICMSSGIGAQLFFSKLPISSSAKLLLKNYPKFKKKILNGGDDYEIVFTASSELEKKIETLSKKTRIKITKIGVMTRAKRFKILDHQNHEIKIKHLGYQHF